jgi:serine protease Do
VVLRNQEGEAKIVPKSKGSVLETLGVELEELDSQTASDLGIDGGLKVNRLGPGKLREHTDIRKGFIITKVDGKATGSVEDFVSYVKKAEGGIMLEGVYEDYPGTYYYAFGL